LEGLEVAAEQGVIGDDDVVLGDLFAEIMPGGAAFQDEHFEVRGETIGFAPPVVEDGGGADDQDGLGFLRRFVPSQASQARVWRVLPRPMSSARMPPSLSCVRWQRKSKPDSFW
jgi:hypothetical protein